MRYDNGMDIQLQNELVDLVNTKTLEGIESAYERAKELCINDEVARQAIKKLRLDCALWG